MKCEMCKLDCSEDEINKYNWKSDKLNTIWFSVRKIFEKNREDYFAVCNKCKDVYEKKIQITKKQIKWLGVMFAILMFFPISISFLLIITGTGKIDIIKFFVDMLLLLFFVFLFFFLLFIISPPIHKIKNE